MRKKKLICLLLCLVLIAASVVTLCACKSDKVILIWGPTDHKAIYEKYLKQFWEDHADQLKGWKYQYAGSGDAGAYAAMNVDATKGAAVYTFANDQMANLRILKALAPITGDNLTWSQEHNDAAAFEATFMGEGDERTSFAYPLQADNGYYMYYNKDAFRGTSVWDTENDCLKEEYTFRDLYAALDEKTDKWKDGKVTWALGDAWYVSGVFFAVGGDYDVQYSDRGIQTSATCKFSFTLSEGQTDWKTYGDFTLGWDAYECMKNTITVSNTDNTINKHFLYSDNDKNKLNENVDIYSNPDNPQYATPLAAAICGTWKAEALSEAWGEDYAATWLPMLESDDGELFAMKNFRGYKHMGVNPQCAFAKESRSNLALLHELAQYLCGEDISIERFESTGAGPALLSALSNEKIVNSVALQALNSQYNRECNYPDNYSKEELRGQPIGNGKGYRDQDSVPANYWTPIQNFGNALYSEFSGLSSLTRFKSDTTIKNYLAEIQNAISQAAQA